MSVTVSATPFLLISALTSIISATYQGVNQANQMKNFHLEMNDVSQLFNQEFQTQIMDKSLLLKTLEEHGVENIEEDMNNVSCDSDKFHLEFTYHEDKPYTLRVSASSKYGIEELVGDLGSEYTANAQEISYNKIKERLAEKNLEIEGEEVYEDNTIVLTVNLD